MKKIICIFSLILCTVLFAQDYSFNRLVQYEENNENTIQLYFNTENPDYYLHLIDNKKGEYAEIFDKKAMQIHHFQVTPLQKENGLIYEYKYLKTKKLPSYNSAKNQIQYEFTTQRDDKYYRFSELNFYHHENSTSFLKADLTMRYTEENLFNAFNLCCLLGFDQWNSVQTDAKFVVVRARVVDEKSNEFNYKLIDDQHVQFKLRVNQK
ncbi:MAG: hypothetical protein Q4G27_01485 [Flavobacteriaceae bacterium]|nr:hypothetical protein [Flavobacteriaceae bacterium]